VQNLSSGTDHKCYIITKLDNDTSLISTSTSYSITTNYVSAYDIISTTNLVYYLPFKKDIYNYASGSAADLSGALANSAAIDTAAEALYFPTQATQSTGSYLHFNYNFSMNLYSSSQSFSISMWIYYTGTTSVTGGVAMILWDGFTSGGAFTWSYYNTSDYFQFFNYGSSSTSLPYYSDFASKANSWLHLGWSYSHSNTKLTCYVNGSSSTSNLTNGSYTVDTSSYNRVLTKLTFGSNYPAGFKNHYSFKGYMKHFRYYERALTADEMTTLYNSGY
jgi:hypothetical protein